MKLLTTLFASAVILCSLQTLSAVGIPSNLGQTIREYEAIVTSPKLSNAIPPSNLITHIDRINKKFNVSIVEYKILTTTNTKKPTNTTYIATLKLIPNPALGPPRIQVVSIKKLGKTEAQ